MSTPNSYHDTVVIALQRAGVSFRDAGNGALDVGPGVRVDTGSRAVTFATRVSESDTHRKTNYSIHRFTGRGWARRLARAVVEGVCPVCGVR